MYSIILISQVQNKLSSNIYFENLFDDNDIDWTAIYMLTRLATYNAYTRSFQYKFFDKVLFRNKKLYIFGIKSSPSYSFGNLRDETPLHIFYKCEHIKCLWSDINSLVLPTLAKQLSITNFTNICGQLYDKPSQLASGFQGLCLDLKNFSRTALKG